nr:MFS transporter [Candidatus Njordarchaeum guaymaensis]
MASSVKTFAHYRNVVVLAFGNMTVMFGFSMFAPIMPNYLYNILGGTMLIVGLFTSMFALVRALLQPLMGRLSDKVGRKKMIVPALFSYSFVAYLYSTATTAYEFIFYRAAQGVSSSTLWPASDALIADTIPTKDRAKALGAVSMTYQVGTVIAPFLGAMVAYVWGYKEVFYVCGLFALAGATLSLLFLREPRKITGKQVADNDYTETNGNKSKSSATEKGTDKMSTEQQLDSTMRVGSRVMLFLGVANLLLMFTFSMVDVMFPIFVISYFGGTLADVAIIYLVFGLVGALGAILGGSLADKYGKRRILLVGTASSIFYWLGLSLANNLALFTTVIGIFVLISGTSGPAISALVADLTPPGKRGARYGFLGLCNDFGLVFGPIVGGLLFDYLTISLGFDLFIGMQGLFMLNVVVTIIATAIVVVRVKEPKIKY